MQLHARTFYAGKQGGDVMAATFRAREFKHSARRDKVIEWGKKSPTSDELFMVHGRGLTPHRLGSDSMF